jgi:hypothetical protein
MYWKLIAALLLLPAAAWADSCAIGDLAGYEALGAGGCTVKGLPFGSFTFSTAFATGGATAVSASQITVTPVDPDIAAGLNFASAGFSVDAGQAVQYTMTFDVDDPPIIHGWDLQFSDPVSFPAVITITSEECLGAAFVGSVCPTSSIVINTVSGNGITAVLDDEEFFAPQRIVGELTTITLDATTGGSASFTSFTESAIVMTPEPSSVMLLATCAALSYFWRAAALFLKKARFSSISARLLPGLARSDAG